MRIKSNLYGYFKGISDGKDQIKGIELGIPEKEFPVTQGSSSENHIVLLYSDGSSISCGSNNKGQLGIGSNTDSIEFKSVFIDEKFTHVACGEDFTLWISQEGFLYASGIKNFDIPTILYLIHGIQCSAYKQVASIITEKKTVLVWPDFHKYDQYKEYTLFSPAKDISCGLDFVSVLLENQTLVKINLDGSVEPMIVQVSPEKFNDRFIIQKSCNLYTVAIDLESNLWLFGQVGQLKSAKNSPPICSGVCDVFALPNSIVAILSNRMAMVLGQNTEGQLATGDKDSFYEFKLSSVNYPIYSVIGNDKMAVFLQRPITKSFMKYDQSEFIPGYQKYLNNHDKGE